MAWGNLYLANRNGNTYILTGRRPSSSVDIYDAQGNKVGSLPAGAGTGGHENGGQAKKFTLPGPIPPGGYFTVDGQKYQIGQGSRQEFGTSGGGPTLDTVDTKGGGGGGGGAYAPNQYGQYGIAPANLTGLFPSPVLTNYQPIQAAPYKFTDVKKFAKQYGQFNRGEILKNYGLSKDLALDTLGTELQSLRGYVPAASALKRSETSIDNQFNQFERTRQLDSALPEVRGQLQQQGQRAESFANGRIPDPIQDRAFELGIRSGAADNANAGGFGARSSVARKASDLMSARERVDLSKYGDQLLTGNVNQRANIELAPTEYSNAGQQVQVMPSQSFSQLSQNNLSQVNSLTTMPVPTAFNGQVSQNQFVTNQEQSTRTFNATNTLQNDQFNATNQNSFALNKFGYQVGLAGANAGAAQTNLNTQVGIDQQNQATEAFKGALNKAQSAKEVSSILEAIGVSSQVIGNILGGFKGSSSSSTSPTVSVPDGGVSGGTGSNTSISGVSTPDFSINDTTTTNVNTGGVADGGTSGGTGADTSTGNASTPDFSIPSPDLSTGADLTLRSSIKPRTMSATLAADHNDLQAASGLNWGTASHEQVPSVQAMKQSADGVLSTAGIYSSPQPGSVPNGVDTRGNPVYSSRVLLSSSNVAAGAKLVSGVGQAVAPFGVLGVEDQKTLDSIASAASDVSTIASLTDAVQRKDSKAFINTVLKATKQDAVDKVSKQFEDPENKSRARGGVNAIYAATQLYNNWGNMSAAQKSIGIAALGIKGYQTASGKDLGETQIVKPTFGADGKMSTPGLTVAQGLDLLSSGYNAYSLAKNWDQYNTLQKVAGVTGTVSSLASTAQSMGMLGYGPNGAAVPGVTPATLTSIGATPAPQYGVGAVTLPAGIAVPTGFTGTRLPDGTTIATPTPNASTSGPSTTSIVAGGAAAALGGYNVYKNWGQGGTQGVLNGASGGSALVGGLSAMGQDNPYLLGGILVASTLGGSLKKGPVSTGLEAGTAGAAGYAAYDGVANGVAGGAGDLVGGAAAGVGTAIGTYGVLSSDMSNKDKARETRQQVENGVAAFYTAGLSSVAQFADAKLFGGAGEKFRDKYEKFANPGSIVTDKITEKALGAIPGGKNAEQQGRDAMRKKLQASGLADETFSVTLSDGTKADIGMDGRGGKHSVTNPDQLVGDHKGRKDLSSYDVDYTNDLDFAASMGGSTLSRLLAGGSGKNIDQLGGQLGNASLKNVGFNKEMTEDNYKAVMKNQRAMYSQSGIKSKADGYQLANQAFAEGRISETELVTAHQSLNMVFDDGSYGQAQKLMAGRQQGIQAADSNATSRPAADAPTKDSRAPPGGKTPLKITGLPANVGPTKFTKQTKYTQAASQPQSKQLTSWMR